MSDHIGCTHSWGPASPCPYCRFAAAEAEAARLRARVVGLESACNAALTGLTEQQRKRAWDEAGVSGLAKQRNAAIERANAAELQLGNVLALATRMKRRIQHSKPINVVEDCDHLIRFCREAGVVPTVLRRDRPIPFVPTDLRGSTVEPAPTDPNRPRAKR